MDGIAYDQWTPLSVSGQPPKRRYKHGAAVVQEKMFVFGGNSNGRYLADIHVLDFNSLSWSQLEVKIQRGPSESAEACAGHSLIPFGKKILSLAGYTNKPTKSLSVKQFDTQTCTWSTLPTNGRSPTSRGGQSVTRVADTLVVFGGEGDGSSFLNDIHILDLKTMTWKDSESTGTPPSPRSEHAAACYDDRLLFIFGGKSHSTCFGDLHLLDMQTMKWSIPVQHGITPEPRAGHAGVTFGDNWFITGGGNNKRGVPETVVLELSTLVWSIVPSLEGSEPPTSEGSSLVCHTINGENFLVSFGGYDGLYRNEVYALKTRFRPSMIPLSAEASSSRGDISSSRGDISEIKELQDKKIDGAFFCTQCRLLMSNGAEIMEHLSLSEHNCFLASASHDHKLNCMGCGSPISSMIELYSHTCDGPAIYFVKELPPRQEHAGCMTPFVRPNKAAQMGVVKKLMKSKNRGPVSALPFKLFDDDDEISGNENYEYDEQGENEDSDEDDEEADPSYNPFRNEHLNYLQSEIPQSKSDSEDSAYSDETSPSQFHSNSRTLKNLKIEAIDRKMLREKYIIAEAVPPEIAVTKIKKAIHKYNMQGYLSRPQRKISFEPLLGHVCLEKIHDLPSQSPRHRYSNAKALRMVRILKVVLDLLENQNKQEMRENTLHYIYPTEFKEGDLMPEQLGRRIVKAIIEITLLLKISRESLRLRPSPKGLIRGEVRLYVEKNSEKKLLCDCTLGGESCTAIPSESDLIIKIEENEDIKYVLVIEKDTIFHYLAAMGFAERESCILICGKGQPDVATRVLLGKLKIQFPDIPFYAIVDCNPSGIQIFLTYCFGSEQRSHDNLFLAVPDLQYIGLTVGDIDTEFLEKLTHEDVNRANKILAKAYLPVNETMRRLRQNLIMMMRRGGANLDVLMHDNKLVELIKKKTRNDQE